MRPSRIPPLPLDKWGDEEKQALAAFPKSGDPGVKSIQPNTSDKDKDLSALALFLNHPALAKAYFPYSSFILRNSEITPRYRQLLILRVGWRRSAEYEWTQHILNSREIGISDEEIRRVGEGPDATGWEEVDQLVLRAADELIDNCGISDDTWAGLAKYFDTHQLMEIIFIVGTYDMVGMLFNSTGIPLNDNLQSLLKDFPLPG